MRTQAKTILAVTSLSLLLVAAATGCEKRKTDVGETITTGATVQTTTLSSDEVDFLKGASQNELLFVRLGSEAADRGVTPEVKAFGKRVSDAQFKAQTELRELAALKGISVEPTLDERHGKAADDFIKLSSTKLDREYTSEMIDMHEDCIRSFEKMSTSAKDTEVREWATAKLPTLRAHLAEARELKTKIAK